MASGAGGTGGGGGGGVSPTRRCHQRPTEPHQHGRQRQQHTARSCTKPKFNVFAFATPSRLYGKPSLNKTSQLGDFIDGQRKYGGAAAAVGQPAVQNPPCQEPVRRPIQTKQPNAQSFGVSSLTARRILLQSSEMSRSLVDARRIPSVVPSPNNSPINRGFIATTTDLGAQRQKEPVRRLMQTKKPNVQSFGVPGSRAQRILQYLEEMSSPLLDAKRYPCFIPSNSPIDKSEIDITTDLGAKKQKTGFTLSVPVVKTAQLPGSSIISAPITSSSAHDITAVHRSSSKQQLDEDREKTLNPAIILKEESVRGVLKCPGVTSGKEVTIPAPPSTERDDTIPAPPSTESKDPIPAPPSTESEEALPALPSTESLVVSTPPARSSFSPSEARLQESLKNRTSWQGNTCQLPNKVTHNKCIACQATKLPPRDTAKRTGIEPPTKSGKPPPSASGTGSGDKCKPAVSTWECDTCLVLNKPEALRCVACEVPKLGVGLKWFLTLPVPSTVAVTVSSSSSTCTAPTGALSPGDKFKAGSWQCPFCCVFNKAEDNKCVSCKFEKPDQDSAKPVFLSPPTTSAGGSMFGSPGASCRAPVAACTFGQTSTVSSLTFGNSAQSHISQSLPFHQGTRPATTCSTGTAVTPCVLDPGANSNNTTTSGFNLGATTPSSSSATASPAVGATQGPAISHSHGAGQPSATGFRSITSSSTLSSLAAA